VYDEASGSPLYAGFVPIGSSALLERHPADPKTEMSRIAANLTCGFSGETLERFTRRKRAIQECF
jgi:hypothetical protein